MRIQWHRPGERTYEIGVDRGVLYLRDRTTGEYDEGVAWNGLVSVTESPGGAEPNKNYADNVPYAVIMSAEEFNGTIEAFTYPDEFLRCEGAVEVAPGATIGQQGRETFGLAYRTKIGNDLEETSAGYKLHLVYGCSAAPSEKAYNTINDSPEPITFSWEITTDPVDVVIDGVEYDKTATFTIDSTKTTEAVMAAVEAILYGTETEEPRLPLPGELAELMNATP